MPIYYVAMAEGRKREKEKESNRRSAPGER